MMFLVAHPEISEGHARLSFINIFKLNLTFRRNNEVLIYDVMWAIVDFCNINEYLKRVLHIHFECSLLMRICSKIFLCQHLVCVRLKINVLWKKSVFFGQGFVVCAQHFRSVFLQRTCEWHGTMEWNVSWRH